MKLLLTSNGLTTPAIKNAFVDLVGKPASEMKVAFIPTAGDPEIDQSFIAKAIEEIRLVGDVAIKQLSLRGAGRVDVIDIKNFTKRQLQEKLQKYDVIWVNGGNTFYLLYWARKSGFLEIVPELLQLGKVYVGVSAGSVLAAPTIEVAGWKGLDDPNVVHLESLDALGLVDFHIFPHFHQKWARLAQENEAKLKAKVIDLANGQAVLVKNGEVRVI